MVRTCLIPMCPNAKKGNREESGDIIHTFPSKTQLGFHSKWVAFAKSCKAEDHKLAKFTNYGICSKHFSEICFEGNHERKLKRWQIPTIPYSCSQNALEEGTDHDLVDHLYKAEKEIDSQKNIVRRLEEQMSLLLARNAELEKQSKMFCQHNEILNSKYPAGFIKGLLCTDRVVWTNEDIVRAMPMFAISNKAYEHARVKMRIPLPCQTVLKTHLTKMEIAPDTMIQFVLNSLNSKFVELNYESLQNQCLVALDEMSMSPKYVYDSVLDRIFSENCNVTLYAARGLLSSWKTPLLYSYDTKLDTLQHVITELYQNGVNVQAIVSDCGGKNQGLWRDLKIGKMKDGKMVSTSFPHPVIDSEILWFPDPPHLLKNLRNHMFDTRLILPDGAVVVLSWMEELLRYLNDKELRSSDTLRPKNLYVHGQERQNVRLVFQVYSHTTATLIRIHLRHKDKYESVADFFDLVNDFSDLVNTRGFSEDFVPSKSPFGRFPSEQLRILHRAKAMFTQMRIGSVRATYKPFQRGLIMLCENIEKEYYSLKSRLPNFKDFLTKNVNQDYLENYFLQLRLYGGYNKNPDALQVKARVKKLAITSNINEDSDLTGLEAKACGSSSFTERHHADLLHWSTGTYTVTKEEMRSISPELDLSTDFSIDQLDDDQIVSEGGKERVAGYIARKMYETHPELHALSVGESTRNLWVHAVSNGGLIEPSSKWFALFRKFEEYFETLHPNRTVNFAPQIVQILGDLIIDKHKDVPQDIIRFYARVRTRIRVKYMNKLAEDAKYRKRKRTLDEFDDDYVELTEQAQQVLDELSAKFG